MVNKRITIEMYGKYHIYLCFGPIEDLEVEVAKKLGEAYDDVFAGIAFPIPGNVDATHGKYFIGIVDRGDFVLNTVSLGHECLHFVMDVFNKVGVVVDYNNQEVVTYFYDLVFEKLLKEMKQ